MQQDPNPQPLSLAVIETWDITPVLSKEFLDIQATRGSGFTLKRVREHDKNIQSIGKWFCNFLCLLDLRICFCLKTAKFWLDFRIKINQYMRHKISRKALVGLNNLWIHFIFREFYRVSMSKIPCLPLSSWEVVFFPFPEEIVYSFNLIFDIFWNSIYLTYLPQFW